MFASGVQRACSTVPALTPSPVLKSNVGKVALTCLKELAVSATLGMTVALFVPSPIGIAWMINAIVIQSAVSLFFHSLKAFAAYKIAEKGPHLTHFQRLLCFSEWITGMSFAVCSGYNTQQLIHEGGHVLAILSTYKKANPQLEIYPFIGGMTEYSKMSRTFFGKKIGPAATTCFVAASGPVFALLISGILLAIGLAIKGKYPHFSKYLIAWAILDFACHAHYAYTALSVDPSTLSHDFVHLAIFGLHPLAATVGIVAIPILIALGMQRRKPTAS